MGPFATLDRLLGHVIDVENEMIDLSSRAHQKICTWVGETGQAPSDEVLEALQYQDILSQQLGATIEAIDSLRTHLDAIVGGSSAEGEALSEAIKAVDAKLIEILEKAEAKRSAFRGKENAEADDGIEFF